MENDIKKVRKRVKIGGLICVITAVIGLASEWYFKSSGLAIKEIAIYSYLPTITGIMVGFVVILFAVFSRKEGLND